jgi:hypothetical protein
VHQAPVIPKGICIAQLVSTTLSCDVKETLMRKLCALILPLVFAVACGEGGDSSLTGPSSVPAGFSQTQTATVGTNSYFRHETVTARSGTLTIRLTWQDPTVDLDLYLLDAACLNVTAACQVLGRSDSGSGVSEVISRTVRSGERFQTYVENLSATKAQTYTLAVTIN